VEAIDLDGGMWIAPLGFHILRVSVIRRAPAGHQYVSIDHPFGPKTHVFGNSGAASEGDVHRCMTQVSVVRIPRVDFVHGSPLLPQRKCAPPAFGSKAGHPFSLP